MRKEGKRQDKGISHQREKYTNKKPSHEEGMKKQVKRKTRTVNEEGEKK
jgi:hypothetical protein